MLVSLEKPSIPQIQDFAYSSSLASENPPIYDEDVFA